MPRGRPKKIKSEENKIIVNNNKEVTKENDTIKTYKTSSFCDFCNKEIYCQPISIDINFITGKASWHRNLNKNKFFICDSCAKEFNNMIEKYIIKKNNSFKKFDFKEEENKDE